MRTDPTPFRYGAYLCFPLPNSSRHREIGAAVAALIERLGLRNEFGTDNGHPDEAVAFLRRRSVVAGEVADPELIAADAVIHVASKGEATVTTFCREVERLLSDSVPVRIRRGVVRPTVYTGNAMQQFAYADQVQQRSGVSMPNAFLLPLKKTAEWWAKDWMERHTYFLPRYDDARNMVSEGHALAAAAGIPVLLRRTYKNVTEPASDDDYDFLTYFECADADVATFKAVCAALRDRKRNPEWQFVREGPLWHGRRIEAWNGLLG